MGTVFSGCVYRHTPETQIPREPYDISPDELRALKITGLPLHNSHGNRWAEVVGRVVDEWHDGYGSKYVSFCITDDFFAKRVKSGLCSELSLRHGVLGKQKVGIEVSIAVKGFRPGTLINRTQPMDEYRFETAMRGWLKGSEKDDRESGKSNYEKLLSAMRELHK